MLYLAVCKSLALIASKNIVIASILGNAAASMWLAKIEAT
jgi:hypothetical protein